MSKTEQALLELHGATRSGLDPQSVSLLLAFLERYDPEGIPAEHAAKLLDVLELTMQLEVQASVLALLAAALERYPADVLSPVHLYYVRQCCLFRQYEACVPLAYHSIERIPKQYGLGYRAHLQYHFYLGLTCAARQDYDRALFLFGLVVSAPSASANHRTSKIQVDAFKKFLLVGLMHTGQLPTPPPVTSSLTLRTVEILAAPYLDIGRALLAKSPDLQALLTKHEALILTDGNGALLRSALFCAPAHAILAIQRMYTTLPLSKLAAKIGQSTRETQNLLQWMQSTRRIAVTMDHDVVAFQTLQADVPALLQIQELVLSVKLLADKVEAQRRAIERDPKVQLRIKRQAAQKATLQGLAGDVHQTPGQESGVRQAATAVQDLQMDA